MDTTKNLNFSANIPQLEWKIDKDRQIIEAIIPTSKNKSIAQLYCVDKNKCYFATYFDKYTKYDEKRINIEDAKKEIQSNYVFYIFALLNEISAITNDGCLSYNDNIKK